MLLYLLHPMNSIHGKYGILPIPEIRISGFGCILKGHFGFCFFQVLPIELQIVLEMLLLCRQSRNGIMEDECKSQLVEARLSISIEGIFLNA